MRFLPSKLYVKYHYEYFSGKKLNLENPIEFNAKIEWYKVFYRPKILTLLADKHAVRSYVEKKIGAQYLNELYAVYDNVNNIDFNKLPNKFVVKANHTNNHNLIVTNKNKLDTKKAKNLFNKWLSKNQYYRKGQEWAYKDIKPKIIIEKFLKENNKNSLVDYKFYCFNGKPKFIDVHIDRDEDHKQGCFDLEFNILPFGKSKNYKSISSDIEKPSNLQEMAMLSEKLADKLPFVRVDFYSINGKSIFGEMTFYPSDARKEFYPEAYNKIIGDYFILPKQENKNHVITKVN
ncbi:ATP-grasp fold amidoligase family protein [Oceanihabitans sp. 2_MG-2023]|uniref:ATP-grasp fold amidoligase family protein n=1 Tax=Oceanihabitans sp. 2_MG-2023 TaxID=3062661 RepID=UPI0026E1C164|nr:ATP-grasp fold amidoligase family protein [Oceanihabitans sp. 2_MG-2023]MDO6598082.1 ATP-grasp fold amidoligase family protein [Oceanihabitans sp. 2_MG-2023]